MTPTLRRWAVPGTTFAVWAVAAASVAAWGLKLAAPSSTVAPPVGSLRGPVVPDPASIARLLGATAAMPAAAMAAPTMASRLNLVGVVARPSKSGVALISVDGKPARPFRVGASIEEGLVLQSVQGRRAALGASMQSPSTLMLELPALRQQAFTPDQPPARQQEAAGYRLPSPKIAPK